MIDAIIAKPAKLDVGAVIGRTFSILSAGFAPLAIMALLFSAAPQALFAMAVQATQTGRGLAVSLTIVSYIILVVAAAALQAGATHVALVHSNGEKIRLTDCLSTARRTFLPVLAIGLLVGIGVGIGFVLLIVPGVILALIWSVAIPVRVAERRGVIAALERSAALTKGSRWGILLLSLILIVALIVMAVVAMALPVALFGEDSVIVNLVVMPLFSALYTLLICCGGGALYYELRTRKEGAAPTALAAVFD